MSVTLHIFFAGLIAFVPSQNGELTVLVPDAGHGQAISDGSHMEPHKALLVARAGGCQGDCGIRDPQMARILFADQPESKATEALAQAVLQGAGWSLAGVELSISPQDGELKIRDDFSSVADLNRIVPGTGYVDPELLKPEPPAGRIAARLRLRSGEVGTYRLVEVPQGVPSLRFRTLKGQDAASGYSQPLATWVMAEVKVPGDSLEVVATAFGDGRRHSMKLSPDSQGLVELVVLSVPVTQSSADADGPGKHFEMYYDLAKGRPTLRPVPYVAALCGKSGLTPQERAAGRSDLLDALGLGDPRGVYDRLICPLAQLSTGTAP